MVSRSDEGERFWREMLRRDAASGVADSATVAALCLEAGNPDLIPFFLRANVSAAEAQPPQPSVDDRLAAAVKRRFEQQYKPS